jgi:hypothetical protein
LKPCSLNSHHHHHHHNHHHVAIKELGHLLTRSGLTHREVSSVVFLGFFFLLGCSFFLINLLRGIRFTCYVHAFYTSLVHNRPSSDNSMKYLKRIAISSYSFFSYFLVKRHVGKELMNKSYLTLKIYAHVFTSHGICG